MQSATHSPGNHDVKTRIQPLIPPLAQSRNSARNTSISPSNTTSGSSGTATTATTASSGSTATSATTTAVASTTGVAIAATSGRLSSAEAEATLQEMAASVAHLGTRLGTEAAEAERGSVTSSCTTGSSAGLPPLYEEAVQLLSEQQQQQRRWSPSAPSTLRLRKKNIDVESGTVNTLRVRALSNQEPPLSSVPALIIIFHCSPRWTGISPILEHKGDDLMPLANAVLEDCSEDPDLQNSTVLQVLPSLGCTVTRAEAVVELLYKRPALLEGNALPCPLDQYRLHKCGLRSKYAVLTKLMSAAKHLYSGKSPLNVTDALPPTTGLRGTMGDLQFSLFFWLRQHPHLPSDIPGDAPIEVLFYGRSILSNKISTLTITKRGTDINVYLKKSHNRSSTSWTFSSSSHIVEEEWVLMTVNYHSEGKEQDVGIFLGRDELEMITSGPILTVPSTLADELPEGQSLALVGAAWSTSDPQKFSHLFKTDTLKILSAVLLQGQIADMSLLHGAVLKSTAIECLIDCKPRLTLNQEVFHLLTPSTKIIWELPLHGIRVASPQAAQVSSVLQRLKVVNLDIVPSMMLRLTSYVQCLETNTTSSLPEVNVTLIDTAPRKDLALPHDDLEGPTPQSPEDPCGYRLRLQSTSLQALEGTNRAISVSEAKRGQYLIPDANLTWEASDPRCLEELEHLGVNVLSCNANSCGLLTNRLQLGQETIFVGGFSTASLNGMGIRFERTRSSYGIVGKASTDVYNDLLRHMAWKHRNAVKGLTRCVSIQCTAMIQDDDEKMIVFHRSNQLETQFRIVDSESFETSGEELIDHDEKRVFFEEVQPVAYPLQAGKKPRTHTWGYWVGVMILAVGLVVVLAGLVWVRNKSIRRRRYRASPSFTQNFITTTVGYVAANEHCREGEDDEEEDEDEEEEDEDDYTKRRGREDAEEDIWVPVIRPKFASRRSTRAELKPKQRVHFQMSRVLPPPPPTPSPIDSSSSSDSENDSATGFELLKPTRSCMRGVGLDQKLLISDGEDAAAGVSSTTHSVDYKHPLEWTAHDYSSRSNSSK
ncbi:unnamed protein product [Taenia asiatica]|uniref:Rap-GAP domain-containing protein n=1 Tax=Taenia asiatica TaxID=60517 RepID=A0A158RA10_TAEAS|nr:unnamed protein product [Taenia asiatica]